MAFKNLEVFAAQLTTLEVVWVQTLSAATPTKGRIYVANGTAWTYLERSVTNGQVLTVDTTTAEGVKWATPGGGGLSFTSPLNLSGATVSLAGLSSLGTGNYVVGVNAGGTAWEYKQIIQGTNMTITQGVGSITFASSGGGGGTPGGSNKNVQFNDSSSFGGDNNFNWDKTLKELTLSGVGGGNTGIHFGPSGISGGYYIQVLDQTGVGADGDILHIIGGAGNGTGSGSAFEMIAGLGGLTSGAGGDFSIIAGSAQAGDSDGGSIYLEAGGKTGSGVAGKISIKDGASTQSAVLNTSLLAASDKTFTFPNLSGTFTVLGNSVTGSGSFVLETTPTIVTPTISNFVNATHNHQAAAGGGTLAEAALALTNVATNNATTLRHGFLPILDNNVAHFLNGQGNWVTGAAGAAEGYFSQSFSSQTSVNVVHNLGGYPVVQVIDGSLVVEIPYTITHNSVNDFTVTFSESSSGTIIATLGIQATPAANTQVANYPITANDRVILANGNITVTLPTAIGISGRFYYIKRINASGNVTIDTTSSQTIDGDLTLILVNQYDAVTVVSDGSNWQIL